MRRRGGWGARVLVATALVAALVQAEVTGVGGPGGPAPAAAATPPVNVWGFDEAGVVAGTGTPDFGGDGGSARQASLREPSDLVASPDGTTWYVADTWNNRIRVISRSTGVITTLAGSAGECGRAEDPDDGCGDGGPATSATLNRPSGIALDPAGTVLYIADTNANLVRAVTLATGVITTVAGTGIEGYRGDGGPATAAALAGPSGVAVGPDGTVYVADTFNSAVRAIAPDGTMFTYAGTGVRCTPATAACGDGGPATSAQLSDPVGVSLGPPAAGLVIADTGNHKIRLVDPSGAITTIAGSGIAGGGGDGGPATAAQLSSPRRAVVGTDGEVWVADTGGSRIRIVFAVPDLIFGVAGTGTPGSGPSEQPSWGTALRNPASVLVLDGELGVVDTANHVVRFMVSPHAHLSFTVCGPSSSTPGGRTSLGVPLTGFPATTYVIGEAFGAAGGSATVDAGFVFTTPGGAGGYARGAFSVDPAADTLFAAVGCRGVDGSTTVPGGGGGGGSSAIEIVRDNRQGAVLVAGGGGGESGGSGDCMPGDANSYANPGANGANTAGAGPTTVSGGNYGGSGEGGNLPGSVGRGARVLSGGFGWGGPGGKGGGPGAGAGGWGTVLDPGGTPPHGTGGDGTAIDGKGSAPCYGTGGGGGGYGGGAAGDSSALSGSGGGSFGACKDATTTANRSSGDGSVVVEITSSAPSSCVPIVPFPAPSGSEDAHARAWAGTEAAGNAQDSAAALPPPSPTRLDAAATVDSPACPSAVKGQNQTPGPGQVAIYGYDSGGGGIVDPGGGDVDVVSPAPFTGPSWLIDTGVWDEATCPILNPILSDLGIQWNIWPGPGMLLVVQRSGFGLGFVIGTQSFVVDASVPWASGAVLTPVDALKELNACPGCDLSGATLSELTFPPGTDLSGANLSGATIANTDLNQANLSGTKFGVGANGPATISDSSFQGAYLQSTAFDRTIFKAARFETATLVCPSFTDTVLLDASFYDATWSSPSCPGPTFSNSVLEMDTVAPPQWANVAIDSSTVVVDTATQALAKGITLSSWAFTNSSFVGLPPDLSGITVTGATLDGSSLMLADLTGATFHAPTSIQSTVFMDAAMDGAKLPSAVAHGAVFTGANLEGADLNGAQLGRGPDPNAPLATATFRGADAHGANFASVEARGVEFDEAYLYPGDAVVSFDGAVLENATFTGAILGSTDFTNITGAGIGFDDAQCVNCDFTGARIASARFDSAYIYGAAFKGATMTSASFVDAACCGEGTWSYQLGANASAAAEPYALDPEAPNLNGPEFDSVSSCPSGLSPRAGSGCAGQTTPAQPPVQPECSAAADHDCPLDIALLAGSGDAGYSDGGTQRDAKLAAFHSPADVAYDPTSGDAIVADTANRVVRRITQVSSTAPHVSIVAGTPPAAGAPPAPVAAPPKRTRPRPGALAAVPTLITPSGVAVTSASSAGTIGIADSVSHIVFTTTGASAPRPLAGTGAVCPAPTDPCGDGGPASRAELNAPQGIWFDPNGNLYIADTGNNRIRRVDASGNITTVAGTGAPGYGGDDGPARAATFAGPTDVVGDRLGNLYVADAGNAAIRKIDPAGTIITLAGGDGSLTRPTSITVDGRSRLYLTDAGANTVATLNLFGIAAPTAGTGTAGYGGDGGPALAAELSGPLGIAAVGDDTLYVADTANQRIRVVQPG